MLQNVTYHVKGVVISNTYCVLADANSDFLKTLIIAMKHKRLKLETIPLE
jgi:hypothetical protein